MRSRSFFKSEMAFRSPGVRLAGGGLALWSRGIIRMRIDEAVSSDTRLKADSTTAIISLVGDSCRSGSKIQAFGQDRLLGVTDGFGGQVYNPTFAIVTHMVS